MKADPTLVVVGWLWLACALPAVPFPVTFIVALLGRGWASIASSGIGGGGFALLNVPAVLTLLSFPPLVVLSLLYAFLYWRRRERGVRLGRRFAIPLYGSVLLASVYALMVAMVGSLSR